VLILIERKVMYESNSSSCPYCGKLNLKGHTCNASRYDKLYCFKNNREPVPTSHRDDRYRIGFAMLSDDYED